MRPRRAVALSVLALTALVGCKSNGTSASSRGSTTHPLMADNRGTPGGDAHAGTVSPAFSQSLYDRVKPSLVAVQYTFANELGRQEIIGSGLVVGSDGLVMTSMAMFPVQLPNEQLTDFKVIVPGDVPNELDATFEGRDERSSLAFVRTKEKQNWPAIEFTESPRQIGEVVLSVGMLPKQAGYHPFITQATVAANLRGPTPQTLVSAEGLTSLGAPVFDGNGKAIGLVNELADQPILLNDPRNPMGSVNNPPRLYVPARDFMRSLSEPPKAGEPLKLPWLGVSQLTGVNKEVSEFLKLDNQPAVQVGAVIPGYAAEKAGLKAGDIILKVNGQPLERGDEPEEAAMILLRKVRWMKPGDKITFSVMKPNEPGAPLHEVTMTLEERPGQSNQAKRFYAEDLGFTTRELVFEDRYDRRLPNDFKGVLVALVKPGSSAQSGHLQINDLITQLNRKPVENLEDFKKQYQEFRKTNKRDAVVLEVLRGVNTEVVRIEPPQ